MFSTNDYIIYGNTGICKIESIKEMKFGNNPTKKYYIIKPVYGEKETIYSPIDNTAINIRKIMNLDEVKELINEIPKQDTIWIEDISDRKEKYSEIIKGGNRHDLVKLIKTLYLKKQEKAKEGKKLMIGDEKLMQEAEKILHQELALILDIKPEEVAPFITSELKE